MSCQSESAAMLSCIWRKLAHYLWTPTADYRQLLFRVLMPQGDHYCKWTVIRNNSPILVTVLYDSGKRNYCSNFVLLYLMEFTSLCETIFYCGIQIYLSKRFSVFHSPKVQTQWHLVLPSDNFWKHFCTEWGMWIFIMGIMVESMHSLNLELCFVKTRVIVSLKKGAMGDCRCTHKNSTTRRVDPHTAASMATKLLVLLCWGLHPSLSVDYFLSTAPFWKRCLSV